LLRESNGILQVSEFQKKAGLSGKSQYNILREMRVLGIANVKNEKVSLQVNLSREEKDLEDSLRGYLRDRLRRNRLVWRLLDELKGVELLTLEMISEILMRSCPYISATSQTWRTYARTFVDWMDYSDLAIFDTKEGTLTQFSTRTELRERRILVAQRRKGVMIPCIQYHPIEKVMVNLVQAIKAENRIDWTGLKKSTIEKSLAALEDIGFIFKRPGSSSIKVLPKGMEFVSSPERRSILFAEGALNMKVFSVFLEILKKHRDKKVTLLEISRELKNSFNVDWKDGTAVTNTKIMLDWARHTGLAPGIFSETLRGRKKQSREEDKFQISLSLSIKKSETQPH
jgi:hypothetical protein